MLTLSITLSLIAIIFSVWLGRKNPVRSSGVTAGMLVLLVFTPLLFFVPKIEVSWMQVANTKISSAIQPNINGDWATILATTWALGASALLIRLIIQCVTIKRWCHHSELTPSSADLTLIEECAEQLKLKNLPEIRYTSEIHSPVITGLITPILLIPRETSTDWSRETRRMIILHELGHLQRHDLWTNMAAQIACAIHWFNPIVWILRKRLSHECEYACDAHVISNGTNTKNYINALCDVAESCKQAFTSNTKQLTPVLAMANEASLKSRVKNVLNAKRTSNPWLVLLILGISSSVTIAYTLIRPASPSPALPAPPLEKTNPYDHLELNLRFNADPFPAE